MCCVEMYIKYTRPYAQKPHNEYQEYSLQLQPVEWLNTKQVFTELHLIKITMLKTFVRTLHKYTSLASFLQECVSAIQGHPHWFWYELKARPSL